MFILFQNPIDIVLLTVSLAVFVVFAWQRLDWAAALVLFLAPVYLLKVKIGWLPLNVLEMLIWLLAGIWAIRKILQYFCHSVLGTESTIPLAYKSVDSRLRGNDKEGGGNDKKRWFFIIENYYFWPVSLILTGAILSVIFSDDLKVSAGIFKGYFLAPLAFGLVLSQIVKTRERLMKIVWALVLSGAAVSVIGLFYRFSGWLTFDSRLAAFYSSPNQLAMYLAPSFLLAIGLWVVGRNKLQRIFIVACCVLHAACLYFTFSYATWLAIFVAMAFLLYDLYSRRFDYKKLFLVFCLLFFILAALFFSQLFSPKIADLLEFDRSSVQSRLMIWNSAKEILKDNWLLGIGPGMFQQKYLGYQDRFPVPYLEWAVPQPHNVFLAFWLQTGLLGLAGFVWLLVNFFRLASASQTKKPLLVLGLTAAMVYLLLHGLVDTTIWKNDLALVFAAITVLNYRASRLFCS